MSSEPQKDVVVPQGKESSPPPVSTPASTSASTNSRGPSVRGHPCRLPRPRRKRKVRKTSNASAAAAAAAAAAANSTSAQQSKLTLDRLPTPPPRPPADGMQLAAGLPEEDLSAEEIECLMDQLSLSSSASASDGSGHSPVPPHLRRLILQQQNRERARVRRIFQPNSRRIKGSRDLVRAVVKSASAAKPGSGRVSARQHAVMTSRRYPHATRKAAADQDEPLLHEDTTLTIDGEEEPVPLTMNIVPTPLDASALAHHTAHHHVETPPASASSSGPATSHYSPSRPGRSREGSASKEPGLRTASAPLAGLRRKSAVTESDDSHSTLVSSTPLASSVKRKPLLGVSPNYRAATAAASSANEHPSSMRRRASTGDAVVARMDSKNDHAAPPQPATTSTGTTRAGGAATPEAGSSNTPRYGANKPTTSAVRPLKQPLLNEKAYTSAVYGAQRPKPETPTSISSHLLKQPLIPELISPEEANRTLTIVLDLDETLCNNRCIGPALIRPGAIALLHRLRDMAPPPVCKEVQRRTQHASNRLYEQAMAQNGLIPRERVSSTPSGDPEAPGVRLEIILWTASVEVVARPVIDRLDPGVAIFDHIIYRDPRWYRDSSFAKDLRRLGRNMDNVAIVENAPASVALNRRQAILVNDFIRNRNDKQLYVVQLILVEWVRKSNSQLRRSLSIVSTDSVAKSAADSSTTSTSSPPMNSNLGPLQQTALRKKEDERKAKAKEEAAAAAAATAASKGESASAPATEHPINIGLFLSKHRFMSPGTSYVKLSAVREVSKLLMKTAQSSQARDDDEEEEKEDKTKPSSAPTPTPTPPPASRSKSTHAAAATRSTEKKKQTGAPSSASASTSTPTTASPPTPASTTKRTSTPSNGTPAAAAATSPRRSRTTTTAASAPAPPKRALSKSKGASQGNSNSNSSGGGGAVTSDNSSHHKESPSQTSGSGSVTTPTTASAASKCGLSSAHVLSMKSGPKKEVVTETKKSTTSSPPRTQQRAAWQS